ncbi:MAG: glycosyltransferase family 2 protein [Oligoflexia bacterium]|nr:glycosyltransferase family 2 protein [Oligoflexia bacterium]
MELSTFDRASISRLRAALIAGEAVHLVARQVPDGLRIDEIAPLLTSVRTPDSRLRAAFEARLPPPARDGEPLDLTVVIPSHRRVPLGMASLRSQDLRPRVLVLSNGPEGPQDIVGATVLRVPWLGHGATRQAALAHVRSPWVFFTVNDAIPLGRGFLRTLVTALQHSSWDAVVARQVPWPDAHHVTAERLRRWTPSGERTVAFPQADNVGTLYRTESLRRFPFPDVPIAEDAWWSRGRRIGYVPFAPILHSHPRSPGALFRRERAMHSQLVAMGQDVPIRSISDLVAALPAVVRPAVKDGRGELFSQLAELAGQWLGARRGR